MQLCQLEGKADPAQGCWSTARHLSHCAGLLAMFPLPVTRALGSGGVMPAAAPGQKLLPLRLGTALICSFLTLECGIRKDPASLGVTPLQTPPYVFMETWLCHCKHVGVGTLSYYLLSRGYPAPLLFTLLQRDTAASPGILLSSRAPFPWAARTEPSLPAHTACSAGDLGSAFLRASSQAGGPRILCSRISPGWGGCASWG